MPAQLLHTRELFASLEEASSGLLKLVHPLDNDTFNAVPFKDSWTAAQLVVHLIKSNLHIVKSLSLKGKIIERDPAERAPELEAIFLDFSTKLQSPEFILPQDMIYRKEEIIEDFVQSMEQLKEKRNHVNLLEAISHRAFGEITKLELLYFVLYHTQRHTHQLKNICTQLFHHKNQQ